MMQQQHMNARLQPRFMYLYYNLRQVILLKVEMEFYGCRPSLYMCIFIRGSTSGESTLKSSLLQSIRYCCK